MCLTPSEEAAEQFNREILDLASIEQQKSFMRDGARSIPFRAENRFTSLFQVHCLTKVSMFMSCPFVLTVIVPLFPVVKTCAPPSRHLSKMFSSG